MPVPRSSTLRPGIPVNIILKPDQRSGKLTTGSVSEILTRGDHPRGIKVRLADGSVGRVQSLAGNVSGTGGEDIGGFGVARGGGFGAGARQESYGRESEVPESRSLADYVKVPRAAKRGNNFEKPFVEETVQEQMEKQFPQLDTALIAAIIADHDDVDAARNVLTLL